MRFPLVLVILTSTAFAGEFKETVAPADREAIVKAIQGNLPPVDKAAVEKKCQPMLDEYNKAPEASVDKAFEAATCLKAAGSLGAAITTFKLYQRYGKDPAKQKDTLRGLASAYEAAAYFAEAAATNEELAKTYAGEKDAKERLVRATCLRRQLGEDDAAKKDALLLERQFKMKTGDALCAKVKPIAMPAKKK